MNKIYVQYSSKGPQFAWRQGDSGAFEPLTGDVFGPPPSSSNTYQFFKDPATTYDIKCRLVVGTATVEVLLTATTGPIVTVKPDDMVGVPMSFVHEASAAMAVTYIGRFKVSNGGGGPDDPTDPGPGIPV